MGHGIRTMKRKMSTNGAIASDIPAVDNLDADPLQAIQTGDWVEIQADEVGKEALVTITHRG